MMQKKSKSGFRRGIEAGALGVGLIWAVFLLNLVSPWDMRGLGIRPRSLDGLWGILFAPLLHGDLTHILANTGPLFVLLALAFGLGPSLGLAATALIMGLGGGLVWVFGSAAAVHIGASGVIFGLVGFLMFFGLFRGDLKSILVSLAVLIFYGGILFSLLIVTPGVSWSSHLWGFGAGVAAGWVLRKW